MGGASEVEPVGRCFWCDSFVGKYAAGTLVNDFQTAEYSGNVARGSGGVGESHAVDRERRRVVEVKYPGLYPLVKDLCGELVPVGARSFARYVNVGDIESAASVEGIDVGLGQYVIRRGDDVVDGAIAVAKSWKWSEAWHGSSMPVLDGRRCNDLHVIDNKMVSARTVLCDLDGVIWLGREPIPGSRDAVARLRASGRRVVFVTNNSVDRLEDHIAALRNIGIRADGDIVSSSIAAAHLIVPGERVLVTGGPGVAQAVERKGGLVVVNDGIVDRGSFDAVIVGLHRDFDYARLAAASRALRDGARLIATNSDSTYPTPQGLEPGGGSIVAAVAVAGERLPTFAGKPHQPMAAAIAALIGEDFDAATTVMVGDRPETDGLMAKRLGCAFALVRTGVLQTGQAVDDDIPVAADLADLAAVAAMIAG